MSKDGDVAGYPGIVSDWEAKHLLERVMNSYPHPHKSRMRDRPTQPKRDETKIIKAQEEKFKVTKRVAYWIMGMVVGTHVMLYTILFLHGYDDNFKMDVPVLVALVTSTMASSLLATMRQVLNALS